MEKLAYKHNNIGNFYCTCTKCCHKDIWNINEIKEHVLKNDAKEMFEIIE